MSSTTAQDQLGALLSLKSAATLLRTALFTLRDGAELERDTLPNAWASLQIATETIQQATPLFKSNGLNADGKAAYARAHELMLKLHAELETR